MKTQSRSLTSCVSLFSLLFAPQALSAETKEPQFEFHAYGRLGISTNEKIADAGQDQGDGSFGLPTSRHVRDLNYLRIQLVGTAAAESKFNLEAQFNKLAHQTNSWDGAGINLRNAYFEMPIDAESSAWVGARRLEFEDIRLFDKFPLSDTTFYGVGATTPIAGAKTTIALGFKNLENDPVLVAKDSANAAAGNTSVASQRRDNSLFIRHDLSLGENLAIRPTLILTRSGKYYREGKPFETFETSVPDATNNSTKIVINETQKAIVTGKVGAVLSHWGDAGWGNHFVWLEQRPAAGQLTGSDKDTQFGVATSGDYEGFSSSDVGIMYSALLQQTQFKNAQPKYKIENDTFVPKSGATSKSGTLVALAVQPVYYVSDKVHVALDLSHTLTNKVGAELAKPSMTFITPIARYAANKTALATPQLFTSVTFGIYESKARLNAAGTASKTSVTTQTGCEFWF